MKNKFTLVAALITLIYHTVTGQTTFQKAFNECTLGKDVKQTSDGGYIMTGNTSGNRHVSLIKTNSSGVAVWTKTYGFDYYYGKSVIQTSDGGYIVAGYGESFSGYHRLYLVKTNSNGDTLWTKTYGQNSVIEYNGYSIMQTTDGGYIVCGSTDKNGFEEAYLLKTNNMGDSTWSKTYGNMNYRNAFTVRQTTDGGYILGGSNGTGGVVFLIKTNSTGDSLWTKTYPGRGLYLDNGNILQQTTDGGYIFSSDVLGVNIYTSLVKTNSTGDTMWTKTYSFCSNTKGVQQTTDGGYIIIASTNDFGAPGGYPDIFLLKTNSIGDTLWTNHFGTIEYEYTNAIQQTNDGGYILTGFDCNGSSSTYLIKTNSVGVVGIDDPLYKNNLLKIYPNPFISDLILQGTKSEGEAIIYDITGKKIFQTKTQNEETRIETNFPAGLYFLEYSTKNGKMNYKIMRGE